MGAGAGEIVNVRAGNDPWEGIKVPAEFDERGFDDAFKSVRYMVWTETWQRYRTSMHRRNSGEGNA